MKSLAGIVFPSSYILQRGSLYCICEMLGAAIFDEELMLLACAEAFVAPPKATKIIDATTAA